MKGNLSEKLCWVSTETSTGQPAQGQQPENLGDGDGEGEGSQNSEGNRAPCRLYGVWLRYSTFCAHGGQTNVRSSECFDQGPERWQFPGYRYCFVEIKESILDDGRSMIIIKAFSPSYSLDAKLSRSGVWNRPEVTWLAVARSIDSINHAKWSMVEECWTTVGQWLCRHHGHWFDNKCG